MLAWIGLLPCHHLLTLNQMQVKKLTTMATAIVKKVVLLYQLPPQAVMSSLVMTMTSMATTMAVLFVAQTGDGQWTIPFPSVFAT
jgi:hypothetical protein